MRGLALGGSLGLLTLVSAAGCGGPPDADDGATPAAADSATVADTLVPDVTFTPLGSNVLDEAIRTYARSQGALDANLRVLTATLELNGDQEQDGLAILMSMDWCGSGGCSLVVFQGSGGSFHPISRTTLIDPPLWVSDRRTDGWRDILVERSGGERVALQHGAGGYPPDASRGREQAGADVPPGTLIFSPDQEPRALPVQ